MKKRISALLLAVLMVTALLPAMAMAEGNPTEVGTLSELKTALAAGGSIKLTADISTSGTLTIGKGVTIYGDGHTISCSAAASTRYPTLKITTAEEVVFDNVKVTNGTIKGACLDISANNAQVVLKNKTEMTANGTSKNPSVIRVNNSGAKIEIDDSTLFGDGAIYAVLATAQCQLTVKNNSKLTGYAAIYLGGGSAGSVVKVTDSQLNGLNKFEGKANFAVVAIQSADCSVEIENSQVKSQSTGGATQGVVRFAESTSTVKVSGDSTVTLAGDNAQLSYEGAPAGSLEIADTAICRKDAAETAEKPLTDTDKAMVNAALADGYQLNADGTVGKIPPAYAGPVMNWVKVNSADNGVVKSGPLAASAGATVTLYPKAAEGYVLDTVEVLDAEGNAVELDGLKFAIPAGGVTVNATFKLAE